MAYETISNAYLSTLAFDPERSRLQIGGSEVSFHCDKFNTRILKNFEDIMGYQEGGQLLFEASEHTTYDMLNAFLSQPPASTEFATLDLRQRLEAIFELFKVLAYGAITVKTATAEQACFSSATSYLAEGWLENQERWHLDEREGPACHDIRGHLAAAMALAVGKPRGSYKVSETECRVYKNGRSCEFAAEVR